MYPRDIRVNNPTEALIVEQALAMLREMQQTATAAPDGHVLAQVEKVAMAQGRELTRQILETVLNDQAEEVEKKGRAVEPANVADRDTTADDNRSVLTAGSVQPDGLFVCRRCVGHLGWAGVAGSSVRRPTS
jgi:hypothetical protein